MFFAEPTLKDKADQIQQQLGLPPGPVAQVVDAAARELGLTGKDFTSLSLNDKVARLHAEVVSSASGSAGLAQDVVVMGQVVDTTPMATSVPMQMPMATATAMPMAPVPMKMGRGAKIDFREPRVHLDLAPVQITGDCCCPFPPPVFICCCSDLTQAYGGQGVKVHPAPVTPTKTH